MVVCFEGGEGDEVLFLPICGPVEGSLKEWMVCLW